MGCKTLFRPEFVVQAEKLCRLGATNIELADFFGVGLRTIARWQADHEDFYAAVKVGKDLADERVVASLYHRALGYTYDAVKIFPPKGDQTAPLIVPYREHAPPDTTACIFWLKNRRPDLWRDVHRHEHVDLTKLTDEQLRAIEEALAPVSSSPIAGSDPGGEDTTRH